MNNFIDTAAFLESCKIKAGFFSCSALSRESCQVDRIRSISLYKTAYFKINNTASTYIKGVIFFALPQTTFKIT